MYLTANTDDSGTAAHFRGQFLPVSFVRKAPFCVFKFLFIFETLPDTKFCLHI
jgi:hypothetical protein